MSNWPISHKRCFEMLCKIGAAVWFGITIAEAGYRLNIWGNPEFIGIIPVYAYSIVTLFLIGMALGASLDVNRT